MNSEFVEKIIQAKHLECEAILSMLPKSQQDHVQVIEKEFTAMVREFAVQGFTFVAQTGYSAQKAWNNSKEKTDSQKENEPDNESNKKKVKKIIIE